MQTPASIARHPIHPMLVPIPIGLWIFSFVCDLFHAGGATAEAWTTVAFYTMAGGIIGALLAALPGLIDLLSLPEGPFHRDQAHGAQPDDRRALPHQLRHALARAGESRRPRVAVAHFARA